MLVEDIDTGRVISVVPFTDFRCGCVKDYYEPVTYVYCDKHKKDRPSNHDSENAGHRYRRAYLACR